MRSGYLFILWVLCGTQDININRGLIITSSHERLRTWYWLTSAPSNSAEPTITGYRYYSASWKDMHWGTSSRLHEWSDIMRLLTLLIRNLEVPSSWRFTELTAVQQVQQIVWISFGVTERQHQLWLHRSLQLHRLKLRLTLPQPTYGPLDNEGHPNFI